MIDIKFIPTGHIFSLPDEEAIRIIKEDRGNYEIVKGKIKEEKAPSSPKTVQELVVVDNKNTQKEEKTETKTETKPKEKTKTETKTTNKNTSTKKTEEKSETETK